MSLLAPLSFGVFDYFFFSFSVCIYVAHMTYIEMFKVVIFCYFYFRHRLFKTKYSTREFMQLTELVQFFF